MTQCGMSRPAGAPRVTYRATTGPASRDTRHTGIAGRVRAVAGACFHGETDMAVDDPGAIAGWTGRRQMATSRRTARARAGTMDGNGPAGRRGLWARNAAPARPAPAAAPQRGAGAGRMRAALMALLLAVAGLATAPAWPGPPCRLAPGQDEQRAGNAGCLVRVGERMLVLQHRWGGYLGIPGGRGRAGESAQCTAHRETWEETGLDVEVGQLLMGFVNGFSVFACRSTEPVPRDADIPLPDHATNEISGVLLRHPDDIDADDWRFPSQWGTIRALFLLVPDSAEPVAGPGVDSRHNPGGKDSP